MTSAEFDLRLTELLASRLCHELVNPIGAVSNGVEMLEDEPGFAAESTRIIAESARQAARRLDFYRIAYGSTTQLPIERGRDATLALFMGGRVLCDWPQNLPALPDGGMKLACNLMVLGAEAIPRGGRVSLTVPDGTLMAVFVQGPGARTEPAQAALAALTGTLADLTPRTVQAAFAGALARRLGGIIRIEQTGQDEVILAVLPAPAGS